MVRSTGNKRKIYNSFFLIVFPIMFMMVFFVGAEPTHAEGSGIVSSIFGGLGDGLMVAFKLLIYAVFSFFGILAGIAITLFDIMIQPAFFQTLNQQAVYDMWKFIRDFFNLFFILTLLYIAFTIIFQVAKDYKKTLLNLVIMALLVNFSFPISRFLIDAGNVPMYYFANQISDKGTSQGLGKIFNASKLEGILIKGKPNETVSVGDITSESFSLTHLLAATVFIFVFSITLLVLAVMFVIRFVALVILVIFSSVGFAGVVIPGMGKYASMWWDNFTKYVIYGPAAMLMLLVAVRFFEVAASSEINRIASQSATNLSASGLSGFMSSAAVFAIPIVMLWFAIGLSSSMSIAGSGAVVGAGHNAINWTRKKAVGGAKWAALHNPIANTARGAGQGLKEGLNKGKLFGADYGSTKLGKFVTGEYWKSPSRFEAGAKGVVAGKGWKGGVKDAQAEYRDKRIREKLEEHKKNKTNASELESDLKNSKDEVTRKAAALALADSKDITSPDRLHLALAAVADDMDQYAKVLQSADGKSMGVSAAQLEEIVAERDANGQIKKDPTTGKVIVNDKAYKAVSSRMKKEGRIDVVVDYRVQKLGENQGNVIRDVVDKMTPEEIAKQADLLKHATYGNDARIEVGSLMTSDPQRYQEIKKRATGEISKLI